MNPGTSLLDGRVRLQSLPEFHGPAGPEAPVMKRLLLEQGELAQVYDADEPMHYLACIELKAGGVRGNHYHRIKDEWVYVVRGELRLHVLNIESLEYATAPLRAGDLVWIRAGIAHALETLQPGFAIEFSGTRHDPADTHRHPCIPPRAV